MKLLIVDDEKLTRDGLLHNIDWPKLGISGVAQADDGVHGLEIAATFQPDILLSDIRMPRMTGIEMAEKLEAQNPFLSVIFMSGYSDKEYLKAAIKLKAINYVEKPIDLQEIEEAITQAVAQVTAARMAADSKAISLSYSRSKLATTLSAAPKADSPLPASSELDFDFPVDPDSMFFTCLVSCYHTPYTGNSLAELLSAAIDPVLATFHLKEIHSVRQGHLFFCHIYGFKVFTDNQKNILGNELKQALDSLALHYTIVFGKNVQGAANIYNSYNSAVIELQNAFFYPQNTILVYTHKDDNTTFADISKLDIVGTLKEALLRKDERQIGQLSDTLLSDLTSQKNVLPNQVKDLYYKLLNIVLDTYHVFQIPTANSPNTPDAPESLWGHVSSCESIYELHSLLIEKMNYLFSQSKNKAESSSTIYLIKDFIATHYQDDSLSIKDISDHVYLSSSYICTLFKNETGQTLNQYLTDYRINEAKRLLLDSRYKIADISAKVGYSDGNYFGKTFKKMVGMSPSEYREQHEVR